MSGDQAHNPTMAVLARSATMKAAPDRFTGDVWVDGITDGGPGFARLAMVRFSPGARTAWHCHARGQTLHVTEGTGIVAARGGPTVLMTPGTTVFTPPGIWHWHGATVDCFMCHLALADSGTDPAGPDVEWGSHVTDDEYSAALAGAAGTDRGTP